MIIVIDKKEYEYYSDKITGRDIKRLAGVSAKTMKEDNISCDFPPHYEHYGVWQLIRSPEPDIRIYNDDVITLDEYKYNRRFFTGSLAVYGGG